MNTNISILISVLIFLSCKSNNNSSSDVSYHFFRQNGKIGIVDSRGEITCEPKFESEKFYPIEFNNLQHSKFTSLYDDNKNRNLIIDIYGNEPFPNTSNHNYKNYGNLAIYFDDFPGNKGLHILSLSRIEEIGYFENRVAINFYGNTKYFYSILDNKTWKLFNEHGVKIHEKKYRLDVDIIEKSENFEAIVLSERGTKIKYINSNGKELTSSKSLQNKTQELQKQKEINYKKEYPRYSYQTIPITQYPNKVKEYDVTKAIKYENGEEFYIVSKNSKQGVIDSKGKYVLKIKYDKIKVDYNMLFFHYEDKIGMANLDGDIIFQPKFGSIRYEPNNSRYIDLKYEEYWFEADINGRIFTPKHIEIK